MKNYKIFLGWQLRLSESNDAVEMVQNSAPSQISLEVFALARDGLPDHVPNLELLTKSFAVPQDLV